MKKAYVAIVLCAFAVPGEGIADVHKCADADGNIMYSQTPCDVQSSANANMAGFSSQSTEMDCGYANGFALSTARRMRVGISSAEVFNLYGGVDTLSTGTRGAINYVYDFYTNGDVSVEQIAALTEAECQSRSLGVFNCQSLPPTYTETIGGCPVVEATRTEPRVRDSSTVRAAPTTNADRTQAIAAQPDRTRSDRSEVNDFVEQCEKWYRDSIDHIDAQLQRDITPEEGEFYRKELRELTQRLREC